MSGVYYNDSDLFCCAWLRNLIAAGHLPAGEVDERPIQEVTVDDVRGFRQCHWFAGVGGWPLALQLAGWPADRPVWTGSCPCQPFSAAGQRRGISDKRHLWPAWFTLIRECRPAVVIGEQVASSEVVGSQLEVGFVIAVREREFAKANRIAKRLVRSKGFHYWRRWLDAVCGEMEGIGYSMRSEVLGAHSVGAPHLRQRLWFVADSQSKRESAVAGVREGSRTERDGSCLVADAEHTERRAEQQADGDAHGRDGLGRSGNVGGVDNPAGARQQPAGKGPEGEARDDTRLRGPERRRAVGRMADALPAGQPEGRAESGDGQATSGGGSGGMAHPDGRQPSDGGLQRSGEHGQQPQDGGAGELGHAPGERRSEHKRRAGTREEPDAPSASGLGDAALDGKRSQYRESEPSDRRESKVGGPGPWGACDWLPCRDGKARPVPAAQPRILLLADGFWYRLAPVLTELTAQAMREITIYAKATGTSPAEVVRTVRERVSSDTVRANEAAPMGQIRGVGNLQAPALLLHPLWDALAARAQSSPDGGGESEANATTPDRVLRDLRIQVEAICSSLRRESHEQCGAESPDPLSVLSRFLASCCAASDDFSSRANAAAFPLSGKVAGRVGMLRGFGNAINPWTAVAFVRAYMETQP